MKISNRQLAKNLYIALGEVKDADKTQVLKNFVEMIYKMRKMSQIKQIIEEYISYEKEMDGHVALEVTTAHALTSEMKNILEKEFGEKVSLSEKIDEGILGGIIIKTNNTIYDASIKAGIEQLKNTL